jgi:nicotinate phosphoribosyltransferase
MAPDLKNRGIPVKGVRLDSGDLGAHACQVRRILDEGGLEDIQILASGNLDEHRIQTFVQSGAPIDSFAVGTAMTTSADAPSLDCAYKLQEYAGRPCRKRSEGKATWPGRKQVYRVYTKNGRLGHDIVTMLGDPQEGDPLLSPVMKAGRRLAPTQALDDIRKHVTTALARIPDWMRGLDDSAPYDVRISQALHDLAETVDHRT